MQWDIIDTGLADPQKNMQIDQDLLDGMQVHSNCILHLYEWKGSCATHGYFIDPAKFLNSDGLKKHGVSIAKRPTGGGIIFHQYDLAFSALVPSTHNAYSVNTLDNYAFINSIVAGAIKTFIGGTIFPEFLQKEEKPVVDASKNFCMAKPTVYDVMIEGRKVGGGAQRRTKSGYLHQGSIALTAPSEQFLQDILILGPDVINAMRLNSYPLLENASERDVQDARIKLKDILIRSFTSQ